MTKLHEPAWETQLLGDRGNRSGKRPDLKRVDESINESDDCCRVALSKRKKRMSRVPLVRDVLNNDD
jgi:hypothetical protein